MLCYLFVNKLINKSPSGFHQPECTTTTVAAATAPPAAADSAHPANATVPAGHPCHRQQPVVPHPDPD